LYSPSDISAIFVDAIVDEIEVSAKTDKIFADAIVDEIRVTARKS
jgi:hypothetical protein